jgi:hypothetical protein
MWNWYCEYLLNRFRQLESACAAEGSRRLADLRGAPRQNGAVRPPKS